MRLNINFDSYLELEKIGIGAFKPLKGFMTESDFYSVVDHLRLPNGKIFPLPVILPISYSLIPEIKKSKKIYLSYKNTTVATMEPESIFKPDFKKYIKKIFGTNDESHPGYKMLLASGKYFLGGSINFLKKVENKYTSYEKTPLDVRKRIKELGLKYVAGFQTRNVPHKAHEHILQLALQEYGGLLIQPLIGKKKKGDFLPEAVMTSYNVLIKNFLPENKIILGALTTSMRYAGPREAIFHALIRRNYGCTHFLVGRDHAGVGDYYGEYEAQNLCKKYEKELKIKIVKIRGPFYCDKCKKITTDDICKHSKHKIPISGTAIRNALINNNPISDKFMRPEIINSIKGKEIFINDED
ncbi:MAG: Sulfate adenylyltransferase [Alphaproteobacteria bacterium MarineAlpha9_Bin3]|nr:MAG: Sulfate adenylyltransferase [Alphaproteobacteria bacterium MarineAlpha9_Bin3]|tara:strand:+ start:52 stop:1116 length:1065 start_codon:yes stop_codon:yes gene_type:complete